MPFTRLPKCRLLPRDDEMNDTHLRDDAVRNDAHLWNGGWLHSREAEICRFCRGQWCIFGIKPVAYNCRIVGIEREVEISSGVKWETKGRERKREWEREGRGSTMNESGKWKKKKCNYHETIVVTSSEKTQKNSRGSSGPRNAEIRYWGGGSRWEDAFVQRDALARDSGRMHLLDGGRSGSTVSFFSLKLESTPRVFNRTPHVLFVNEKERYRDIRAGYEKMQTTLRDLPRNSRVESCNYVYLRWCDFFANLDI